MRSNIAMQAYTALIKQSSEYIKTNVIEKVDSMVVWFRS